MNKGEGGSIFEMAEKGCIVEVFYSVCWSASVARE